MTVSPWDSFLSSQRLRKKKYIFCLDYCVHCFLNSFDKWLMDIQATENEMSESSSKRICLDASGKLIKVSGLYSTFAVFWKNSPCSQASCPSPFLWEFVISQNLALTSVSGLCFAFLAPAVTQAWFLICMSLSMILSSDLWDSLNCSVLWIWKCWMSGHFVPRGFCSTDFLLLWV